jgi:hypothetical protein
MDLFDVSFDTANQLYAWGWRASVVGAIITMFGVGLLAWGTRVRDHDFEEQIAGLHTKAAVSENEAANTRERAAKLEERAAGLEKETATAKERTVELQKELEERKNRRITDEQKRAIIERLTPLPKGKVLFNPLMADGEAVQFSDQIKSVLAASGYDVDDVPQGDRLLSLNRTGAFLWFKDASAPPERAKNISTAFRLVGITLWGDPQPDFPDPDTLVVVVGSHP